MYSERDRSCAAFLLTDHVLQRALSRDQCSPRMVHQDVRGHSPAVGHNGLFGLILGYWAMEGASLTHIEKLGFAI